MGARHGEGDGRGAGPPRSAPVGDPRTEALLAAALRGERAGADGERRALVAFRAAREAEPARAARTRRRDDWRPREGRHPGRAPRTALSVLLASLTLGGVAYAAAMGGDGSAAAPGGPRRTLPAAPADSAPARPAATPHATTPVPATTPPGASVPPDHPSAARDTEARCRAYARLEGRGEALDAPAWQRLVTAAGGAEHVAAYCAGLPAAQPGGGPSNADGNTDGHTDGNTDRNTDGNADGENSADPDSGNQDGGGQENGAGGSARGQVPGRDR
ncbi:hypothetical protein [Streptomyces violaceorubidus]|uniref:hypothetical protein n=1 Tax=Streptomyces violaceorubidus TaxID=284042 RepID=UPI000996AAC6|nr:hypothetical protein [Streptomyces violaceorubidus]